MSTQRAAELLARLRAADPLEREVLLSTLADVDPRLRSTFERLLANDGAPPPVGAGGALTDGPGLALLFELGALPVGVGDRVGTVELVGILGEGGMGTVFEGFDARLERRVAVKVLRADHRAGEVARARFRREARILSRLDHAGICQVYDLVERPDADYLILELVEGDTLRAQLRGELAPTHRLEIARALAEALAAAHAKGVVHRDLKPDNVMVRPDGAVKILDFGIARVAATEPDTGAPAAADPPLDATADTSGAPPADPARTTLRTRLGSILGTVAYMSPEQARGEIANLDERTDIYSLGAILYEMLTLSPPVSGPNLSAILRAVEAGEIVPPSQRTTAQAIPKVLESVVLKALARRPLDRYANVRELLNEMRQNVISGRLQDEVKLSKPIASVELAVMLSINRTSRMMLETLDRKLVPYGVRPAQYNIMRMLTGAKETGLDLAGIRDRMVGFDPNIDASLAALVEFG
ncbi:MAG: serine/threonine protein kinase, partial [Thermoanaerobaculia bacterium]|nr:serine/threonine protein kinase [Thermoanaerobaculia bacterium]